MFNAVSTNYLRFSVKCPVAGHGGNAMVSCPIAELRVPLRNSRRDKIKTYEDGKVSSMRSDAVSTSMHEVQPQAVCPLRLRFGGRTSPLVVAGTLLVPSLSLGA